LALAKLKEQDFDFTVMAVGAQAGKRLPLKDGAGNIIQGISFLRDVAEGNIEKDFFAKKTIAVIGGGNVAIDTARSALRFGAEKVNLICLESADEMPAHDFEIKDAKDEGIDFLHSCGVKKLSAGIAAKYKLEMVECSSVFDDEGLFCPMFNKEAKLETEADVIIASIGQEPDLSFLPDNFSLPVKDGLILCDEKTMATKINNIFAVGESATGPGSVVEAIASGKKAALAIDKELGGAGVIDLGYPKPAPLLNFTPIKGFSELSKVAMPCLAPEKRINNFDVIEAGFDNALALAEAKRCLLCDLRFSFDDNPLPPEKCLAFSKESIETVPETEGVFLLLNQEKETLSITGSPNLRQDLLEKIEDGSEAKYFLFETDPMYTKRESELIQQHIQEHGEMPGGDDDDLDDLF